MVTKMTLLIMKTLKTKNRTLVFLGFTLLELMVVLAIISAMMLVVIPYSRKSNDSLKLEQQSLNIYETVKYALDLAVTTKKSARLVINVKNKNYLLEIKTTTNSYEPIKELRYSGEIANIVDMEGFDSDGSNYYLVFDPAEQWPSASFSITGNELIRTISIHGRYIEIEQSSI